MSASWLALALALVGVLAHRRVLASPNERLEYTAYTLDAGEFTLGPNKAQAGLLDSITMGTYVPTWLVWPWLGAPVPTVFVKLRDPFAGPVAVSFRITAVYLSSEALASELTDSNADGDLLIVPLETALSWRATARFSQSVELTYVASGLSGSGTSSTTFEGSAVSSHATLSTFSEIRLSESFALTWLNRILLVQGGTRVRARVTQGATEVDADLGVKNRRAVTACAVPGIQLNFGAFHADLGLGYGSFWLPVVQLPLPFYGLVPEANAYFRF